MRIKDFEEAIKWQIDGTSSCKIMEYQPGNGSRYVIMFTKIPANACDSIGCIAGSWLVALPDGVKRGQCAVLAPDGWLDPSYIDEKLHLSNSDDALVLTEIIGRILNRPAPSAFDEEGYKTRIVGEVQHQ